MTADGNNVAAAMAADNDECAMAAAMTAKKAKYGSSSDSR